MVRLIILSSTIGRRVASITFVNWVEQRVVSAFAIIYSPKIFRFKIFIMREFERQLKHHLLAFFNPFMHNVVKWPNILFKVCLDILQHYA